MPAGANRLAMNQKRADTSPCRGLVSVYSTRLRPVTMARARFSR